MQPFTPSAHAGSPPRTTQGFNLRFTGGLHGGREPEDNPGKYGGAKREP